MVPARPQTIATPGFDCKIAGTVVAVTEIPDTLQSVSPTPTANAGNYREYRRGTAKNSVPETRFRSLN